MKVDIKIGNKGTSIKIDGKEIGNEVTRLTFVNDSQLPPTIIIEAVPDTLSVEGGYENLYVAPGKE